MALQDNTSGHDNVAVGIGALENNTTGQANTAVGAFALRNKQGAFGKNIAIGDSAGFNPTTPQSSIFIGNNGLLNDTQTIKIGTQDIQQTTFIAGISGATTGVDDAVPVLIDSNGQLGTAISSRRYKEDIQSMGDVSPALMKLRPVTFRYRKPYADGGKPIQYGLIAEEVAEVLPGLAVFNKDGQPETVKYHLLPSFLLAGYQRQSETIQAQAQEIAALKGRLGTIEARLDRLDRRQEAPRLFQ